MLTDPEILYLDDTILMSKKGSTKCQDDTGQVLQKKVNRLLETIKNVNSTLFVVENILKLTSAVNMK